MMNQQQIERMKEIGGEWEKYGKHRIYFNDLPALYGLELWHYNSGNISGAQLDGEHLSNNKAKKICGRLAGIKMFYDFADGEIHISDYYNDLSQDDKDRLMTNLMAQIDGELETA